MKRPKKALVLHHLRASEALWGIRRRTALAAVDIDEGAAVGVGDPRDGEEDYGDLVVDDVPVGEAEFRRLDEAVAGWLVFQMIIDDVNNVHQLN